MPGALEAGLAAAIAVPLVLFGSVSSSATFPSARSIDGSQP
jgi:hypothetical protein